MKTLLAAVASACALALAACGGPPAVHQAATGSVHPNGWGKPGPASVTLPRNFAATETATMYDSITLSTIPANPFAVAGYTSGFWPNYLQMRSTWPNAHTVSIAITAAFHADCLDVEPGDAVPSQVAGWVRADIKAGFARPCVYSSYWEYVNQVRPDLAAAGIARSQVFEWDADYTFVDHIDAGFDATQWTDKCLGRNLDCSRVTLAFLSIAQPPYVAPAPQPAKCGKRCHQRRALKSTKKALAGIENALQHPYGSGSRACIKPYRRGKCLSLGHIESVLTQRERWFQRQLAKGTNR